MKNSHFCPGLKDNYTTKSIARNMRSVSNLYLQVRKRKVNFAGRDNHTLADITTTAELFWVVSDSLQPNELQHARLPCPSPTPGAYSDSCPSSWWSHPTISSPVIAFSSCHQSFPVSGSFQMSQFFASGGQSRVSASALVLPMNIQDWYPLGLTRLISLQESSPMPQFKSISSSALSLLYGPPFTSIHDYWNKHSFDNMYLLG